MERRDAEVDRDPVTGQVHEERRVETDAAPPPDTTSEVVSSVNPGWRAVQLVYLVFGVIDGLLLIRLVLKLLGANSAAAFASWIYGVTNVLLTPFRDLLPSIGNGQAQLELAVVVAILVYALIGWVLARLMAILFSRNVTVARRSGRYRPY